MGFFSNILEKLGLKKDAEEAKPAAAAPAAAPAKPAAAAPVKPAVAAPAKPVAAPARPAAVEPVQKDDKVGSMPNMAAAAAAKPVAVSEVDVVKKLEGLAVGSNLDWKVSIVDLLKLLDIDSSREARVELAKELDCPEDLMSDTAKMNPWLHKTVLKKIAENGGNIPASLLD